MMAAVTTPGTAGAESSNETLPYLIEQWSGLSVGAFIGSEILTIQ